MCSVYARPADLRPALSALTGLAPGKGPFVVAGDFNLQFGAPRSSHEEEWAGVVERWAQGLGLARLCGFPHRVRGKGSWRFSCRGHGRNQIKPRFSLVVLSKQSNTECA